MSDASDLRDYSVDFSKIVRTLSYKAEFTVPQGIAEIQQKLAEVSGIDISDSAYVNVKRTRQLLIDHCKNGRHSQSVAELVGSAA